jgi:hypothetical protein
MGNYLNHNPGQAYYNQIHNFAKVNLLLDILMGYSQKNLYADTIVIN